MILHEIITFVLAIAFMLIAAFTCYKLSVLIIKARHDYKCKKCVHRYTPKMHKK